MNINELAKAGFVYTVETVNKRTGEVVHASEEHNLMPLEGINHMLDATLIGAGQVTDWYLALYENNYTPSSADVAATFPTLAGEATAYDSAARLTLALASADAGVSSNAANRSEFEFTEERTIQGGFIISTPTKGSTAGILLSAVKFSSPRVVDDEFILRVTAGLRIVST